MVRVAVPADAGGIAGVHIAAWRVAYRGVFTGDFLGSMDLDVRTGWWEALLLRGQRVTYVVDGPDSIAGFCLIGEGDGDGWGEVFAIYVHPELWGQGIGRALLNAGEAHLAANGLERALLWVLEGNGPARAFYERQGWLKGKPIRLETIGGTEITEVRYEKALGPS